jgi:YhcH/YjgK/YiaL family protein
MVFDSLDNLEKYASLHKSFGKVFKYIRSLDFSSLEVGRIESEDGSFYINVDEAELRTIDKAHPEAHDRYIDIQIPLSGSEYVACMDRSRCENLIEANPQNDISFYGDLPDTYVALKERYFIILFPQDAHAPLVGTKGRVKKMVVKVLID